MLSTTASTALSSVFADYNYDFANHELLPRTSLPVDTTSPIYCYSPSTAVAISDNDLIYYGTDSGWVVCLQDRCRYPDASTNTGDQKFVKWFYPLSGDPFRNDQHIRVTGGPVVADGIVYLTTVDDEGGKIWALDADPVIKIDPNEYDAADASGSVRNADPNSIQLIPMPDATTGNPQTAGISATPPNDSIFSVSSDGVVYIHTLVGPTNLPILTLPSISISYAGLGEQAAHDPCLE
jgi:outer membrane protein assembly factor BamB